jgi:hypothetical protein
MKVSIIAFAVAASVLGAAGAQADSLVVKERVAPGVVVKERIGTPGVTVRETTGYRHRRDCTTRTVRTKEWDGDTKTVKTRKCD